ncbi:LysE family translocator [Leeia oryzae]|uniref:LysE family translocator n=1 Tax=Leeia oryzae TaxID=356662 RepID=UPI00036A5CCB|nr:LysE family translocator [Leeia oryzae]
MFGIQNYSSFILAILVFQSIPGAGTLAILNATARNGVGVGMASVAGTLLGDFCMMLAAVLGLAAVMKANPMLFSLLQWFGAAYLVWMGVQLLRARLSGAEQMASEKLPARFYFRQGFLVSLTNPKVILFFVAFFPLFLDRSASSLTLGIMMLHVTLLSLVYQAGLVLVGNQLAKRLAGFPSARKVATRLAGVALVGFGVKLALGNR